MTLEIIYRCCEAETDGNLRNIRPPWFDKLKCFTSLWDSIREAEGIKSEITVVYDSDGGPLFEHIESYKTRNLIPIRIIPIGSRSNEGSLMECYRLADSSRADVVYFVEDDYIHLPDAVGRIAKAAKRFGIVTGYEHPDRYTRMDDITRGKDFIGYYQGRHWRTVESTCLTFAVSKLSWRAIERTAKKYKLLDREMWRAVYYLWHRLWAPMPAVCTQVDQFMSFGYDWEQINSEI